jgi:uncharacterized protein
MSLLRVVMLGWLALVAAPASAQTFPKLTGRVVDAANIIPADQETVLTGRLEQLEQQSGRQLVVATVPSLEGRTIEDYGYRLGRTWAIGQKGEDDGVVLLVAPNERKVRVETGYGARVFLTDALSSIIIRNDILPRFKAGDYPGGIDAGVTQLVTQMTLPPAEAQRRLGQAEAQNRSAASGREKTSIGPVLVWMLIFFFVLMPLLRRAGGRSHKRRRGWGGPVILWGPGLGGGGWGGGGGGGFGGFGGGGGGFSGGGGSFGGGGASGSW